MKIINDVLLEKVSSEAKTSNRKRQNHNFHDTLDAVVQRMLNALEPGTYVQPHKHEDPDKVEVFIVLKGKALIAEFDDQGKIIHHTVLSSQGGIFGCEIAPRTWHTIISLAPGTVVYEVKEGPYSPLTDKNFAPWAPKENDPGVKEYLQDLCIKCGIHMPL